MELGTYLKNAASLPWSPPQHDCCTFGADWAVACGRPDPMAFIRGRYRGERGAQRRVVAGGGLIALWTRGMGAAGIAETNEAQAGDIGVVNLETEGDNSNEVCAIYTGARWAVFSKEGLYFGPATALKIWRP